MQKQVNELYCFSILSVFLKSIKNNTFPCLLFAKWYSFITFAPSTIIKGMSISMGANVSPTATVKLEIDGVEKETAQTGVGPVDAALSAVRELIQEDIDMELEEYNLEAITGGTDALAEVFVVSSDSHGNKSTGRSTNQDIVMASILAVLDSINKLLLIQRTQ